MKGRAARVGDDDLPDLDLDRLFDQLVERRDHVVPEANIGSDDQVGLPQVFLFDVLELATPGLYLDIVDLSV